MAITQISLAGVLRKELHGDVINLLSEMSQHARAFESTETVYGTATSLPVAPEGEGSLRVVALRLKGAPSTSWTFKAPRPPESARLSPLFIERGVTECQMGSGCHPAQTCSALGYNRLRGRLFKRGWRFDRGLTVIDVYQFFESEHSATALDPQQWIVQVSSCYSNPSSRPQANPSGPQQGSAIALQQLRGAATAAVQEVAVRLKTYVDLQRIDL
ncbi:hypothetical protein ACM66B_006700 [Microbotryomycetes sp. NB124-2]